ncbi:Outer membrane protein beta-barrel domain-containing protein [Paracoccus seriniphilus]|uniref:Outer membrane protein beta-barrel domain-containing protein n=2 Tax=Paracoccus seriniphilus TaxID=184748 RepID=A0A239Q3I0_9RHOB|nr:outer membrane beta-barrel protein [Paracoccus seriniphilus]WCR12735.1 outer membrane beta-barrel protein [Paracoccus seriniphilus]SNT76773.1 Outer membrane protein beta-barrel domain-containing protein [Paracoccus seriniphilus]
MKYMPAIAAATLVAITAAAAAHADDGFYIGGLVGGVSNHDEDFDAGVDLSVFAGYNFGRIGGAGSLRTELQFSGRESEPHGPGADNGTYSEDATFLNAYHDFDMQENAVWIPYIGVGVGRGRIEYNDYRTGATAMGHILDWVATVPLSCWKARRMEDGPHRAGFARTAHN